MPAVPYTRVQENRTLVLFIDAPIEKWVYPAIRPAMTQMLKQIQRLFLIREESAPVIRLDGELLLALEPLAAEEGKSVEEMGGELLWYAVSERYTAVENIQPWDELTPREKQTAALACLGYTNQEMAEIMVISANTVKTHMRHVLRKFNLSNKGELRAVLANWDFSDWLASQEPWFSTGPGEPNAVGPNAVSPAGIST
jgi:DNA-binding CsgD family transcriptional regulator